MAHTFTFENFDYFLLTKEEVMDIVELFYRWEDAKFRFVDGKCSKSTYLGQHNYGWDGVHIITFNKKLIERCFERKVSIGGNFSIAPTVKMAAAQVIVHELMHANQEKLHHGEKGFYGIKNGVTKTGKPKMARYHGRACEREARDYVDVKMNELLAYFNLPSQKGPKVAMVETKAEVNREAAAVSELLQECSKVTFEDINDELRASKIMSPANFMAVVSELKKRGFHQIMNVLTKESVIG